MTTLIISTELDFYHHPLLYHILNILDFTSINLKDFYHKIYDTYGFLYLTSDINNKLKELEMKDEIIIDRYPSITKNGKKSNSMDLSKHTIKVRRKLK